MLRADLEHATTQLTALKRAFETLQTEKKALESVHGVQLMALSEGFEKERQMLVAKVRELERQLEVAQGQVAAAERASEKLKNSSSEEQWIGALGELYSSAGRCPQADEDTSGDSRTSKRDVAGAQRGDGVVERLERTALERLERTGCSPPTTPPSARGAADGVVGGLVGCSLIDQHDSLVT